MPNIVGLYLAGNRLVGVLTSLLRMVHTGVWLGVLSQRQLHALSERKYSQDDRYWKDDYNNLGLWEWEEAVVERDFAGCNNLLLAAAGGGREVIALRQRGIEVQAFESHPGLVRFANELLEREGMVGDVKVAPWDGCPDYDLEFDGVIVGWGAYGHIRGRNKRIKLLQQLRKRVKTGSPILLSFFAKEEGSRYLYGIYGIGRALSTVLRRDPTEFGDYLKPDYIHYFTREQVQSEMEAAGFEPLSFEQADFGRAVGRAV